jgi:hypothetical protein
MKPSHIFTTAASSLFALSLAIFSTISPAPAQTTTDRSQFEPVAATTETAPFDYNTNYNSNQILAAIGIITLALISREYSRARKDEKTED